MHGEREYVATIDVDKLVQGVSAEAPCGKNLEYDPEFGELERAAQAKPEQQFGDTVVDAEQPQWRDVQALALKLFDRTRDLRVATYLTRALLHNAGYVGLADGLAVIAGLLQTHWDHVHPELDEEDDNDPTFRINSLLPLTDAETMLPGVRETALVSSRAAGRFSLRDLEIAEGRLSPASQNESPPDLAMIDAAFMDCGLDELQATAEAVVNSIAHLGTIEVTFADHLGVQQAPDLTTLRNELKLAQTTLTDHLSRRGVGGETDQPMDEEDNTESAKGAPSAAASGEIRSREDVVRMLDRACDYFNRNEPSSPVPLLLQRAKRLVSADFFEVVKELAPDGLTQAQRNAGVENK